MSGILEYFDVASDTRKQLVQAIQITQAWNKRVTHYRTGKDIRGVPFLIFMWHEHNGSPALIAPLEDAEAIADQIYAWLRIQDYGRQPDHDGDNHKGWRVNIKGPVKSKVQNEYFKPEQEWSQPWDITYDHTSYDVFCVQPLWIEYGK